MIIASGNQGLCWMIRKMRLRSWLVIMEPWKECIKGLYLMKLITMRFGVTTLIVYKLKQQEDMRAKLMRRSLSADDEEEWNWDIDDDEEDEGEAKKKTEHKVMENKELGNPQVEKKESSNEESKIGSSVVVDEGKEVNVNGASSDKGSVVETSGGSESDEKVASLTKSDEKVVDNGESCKDSDVSVVSTHPSLQEEEDLGWDEIEDLGNNDEKKGSQSGSPSITDVKKRRTAAEEDEDLSWDIEDDD